VNPSDSTQIEHPAPLFSVIIPVRNDTSNLRDTLASLAEQSLGEPFEVLVSDNGSHDDVAAAVVDYHEKLNLRVLDAADAHGSYGARNVALSEARGTYLAFTDADAVPVREWLAEFYRVFQRAGPDAVLGGDIHHLWENEKPRITEIVDAQRHLKQRQCIESRGFAVTANMAVTRDHAKRLSGFDATLRSGGDAVFGRHALAANLRLIFVDKAVVKHRARHTIRALLAKTGRTSRGGREQIIRGLKASNVSGELRKFFPRGARSRLLNPEPPFDSHLEAIRGFLLHWLLDAYSASVTLGWLPGGDDASRAPDV